MAIFRAVPASFNSRFTVLSFLLSIDGNLTNVPMILFVNILVN